MVFRLTLMSHSKGSQINGHSKNESLLSPTQTHRFFFDYTVKYTHTLELSVTLILSVPHSPALSGIMIDFSFF